MSSVLHSLVLSKPRPRLYHFLLCMWLLSMISLPILRWSFGDQVLPTVVGLSVVLQTATVLAVLAERWQLGRILLLISVIVPTAWLIELIGSSTGLPFGRYHYTEQLVPQIAHVPLLIPLAWLMMLVPAWAVAFSIVGQRTGWKFTFISALAFTAWDLFLDPQMIGWDFWVWEAEQLWSANYFGIPWLNYFGWFISAIVLTWLVQRVITLEHLPIAPLLLIYALTWFLESFGLAFFWGLYGPAVCGFFAMGLFVVWSFGSQTRLAEQAR